MAGILQVAVFLKSRPFSKFHPFYIGISNISTGFAKKTAVCRIPAIWLGF
jgi:hypothetical protein